MVVSLGGSPGVKVLALMVVVVGSCRGLSYKVDEDVGSESSSVYRISDPPVVVVVIDTVTGLE